MTKRQPALLSFTLVFLCVPHGVKAAPSKSNDDKFSQWRQSVLPQYQAYKSYYSTNAEVLKQSTPRFDGWVFFLANYNQQTFRNVSDVMTRFETNTLITTNSSFTTNTFYNSFDLFNSSITTGSMGGMEWVEARSNYLETNFGMSHGDALSNALGDRNFCESNPADCASRTYLTDYRLETFGPDTTTHANPTVTSATNNSTSATSVTHTGNTTVISTTTDTTNGQSTITSSTEVTTQGSRDVSTTATRAEGAMDGTVDTQTQTDERTTVDETTTENTQTDSRTESQTDTETQTKTTRRVRGERYWDLQIAPMVFFDAEFERSITSLKGYYPSISKFKLSENGERLSALSSTSERALLDDHMNATTNRMLPQIRIGETEGPYRVTLKHSSRVGIGAVLEFVHVNATGLAAYMIPFVGVAPVGGISAVSERLTNTAAEAKTVNGLGLPRDPSELKMWKNFEKLSYTTEGGVLFVAGVSMAGLNVGANYVANGTWNTEVQKLEASKVYVKVSTGSLNSLGTFANATLLQVSTNRFRALNKAFSFMFDLKDKAAGEAYRQLLKGNMTLAQKLAVAKNIRSVIPVESSNLKTSGTMRSLHFGIPLLNITSTKGNIVSAEMSDYHPDQTHIEADYGIYLKERDSRFLAAKTHYTYGFYGSAFTSQAKNQEAERGHFGMVGWSYKTTDVDQEKLEKAIHKLVNQTGLHNELSVNVSGGHKNKGNASIEFSLKIDDQATRLLMDLIAQKDGPAEFDRIAQGFISSVFGADAKSPEATAVLNDLLDEYAPQNDANHSLTSRETRKAHAQKRLLKETAEGMGDMKQALAQMLVSGQAGNRKQFVVDYAAFGKAMLKNQFTFQTAFNLIKGRGVSARYTISGEQIRAYDLEFDWKPQI